MVNVNYFWIYGFIHIPKLQIVRMNFVFLKIVANVQKKAVGYSMQPQAFVGQRESFVGKRE